MRRSAFQCSLIDRQRVRAEAAVWIAKIHGPERTHALDDGLRRWLAEDPLHASEFELATDLWNESGALAEGPPAGLVKATRIAIRKRVLRPILAAVPACLLVAAWIIHVSYRSTVSTGTGEQKTVVLADGSRVTLNTDTRIILHYGKQTRTVDLEYGQAYFDVVHDGSRPFIVRADGHKVVDLGTRFMVTRNESADNSLTITVIEGRVAVAPLAELTTSLSRHTPDVNIVSAGQRLRFRPHALPTMDAEPLQQAMAWLNGQLIFDGTPLSDAAAQFNRYNVVKITVASPAIGRIPVGGVFRISDSASFARAVAASHHLILITGDDRLVLTPPR